MNGAQRAAPDATPQSRGRSVTLFLRDVLVILFAAILISFVVKTFLIRSFYIPSPSMENTLMVDDRIIVNELVPDLVGIEHGDVVVFTDPGDWLVPEPDDRNTLQKASDAVLGFVGLAAPDSNDHLIKRVIGLPGDEVACCTADGQLTVNGVPLDEPYITLLEGQSNAAPSEFSVTIPDDELWVMGDNRYDSADSLAHAEEPGGGFVPIDHVVGRAFVISWPAARWSWLDDYPATFEGVRGAD
jgi:signal peptidase I